ncbi:hypothetical protein DEDE109153_08345 [Deinococcus deserti]
MLGMGLGVASTHGWLAAGSGSLARLVVTGEVGYVVVSGHLYEAPPRFRAHAREMNVTVWDIRF